MSHPPFTEIPDYETFCKYYWYRKELQEICKAAGLAYNGSKAELNEYIREYFHGNKIAPKVIHAVKKSKEELTLETKLLPYGFACRNEYREFFGCQTGVKNFRYTADMTAAVKKVRQTRDENFTVRDLLDVYWGKSDYAAYDNSACQWNRFYQAFCADSVSEQYTAKLKAASVLWSKVRDGIEDKIYSRALYETYKEKLSVFLKN